MTMDRNRAVEPSSSSWSTAEGSSTRTGPRLLSAFAAALAATVLMLSGTPAATAPTFNQTSNVGAYPGVYISILAGANFDNAGTNRVRVSHGSCSCSTHGFVQAAGARG